MEELIAKRYIKALKSDSDLEFMTSVTSIFSVLADAFKDDKFMGIIYNPNVNITDKSKILLDAVKGANSSKINNFIMLLVENKRINIIPAIAAELKKDLSHSTKIYSGVVYSNTNIDVQLIEELSRGLSKKFNSEIALQSVINDFNGIKVDVEGLGVEINFSKDRIDSQIIEYIIRAI